MRFLDQYRYACSLQTDTEVITYAVDLLVRRHGLPMTVAARVLAASFWSEMEFLDGRERGIVETLRITYGGFLLNGPFTVIIGREGEMVGLTDRIRLRPLVVGTSGPLVFLSSEESAIRLVSPELDDTWIPVGGVPVISRLGAVPHSDEANTWKEVLARAH